MKFIVFSDLHVEDYPSYNKAPYSRLDDTLSVLKQVFKIAAEKYAAILFAGDLVDKASSLKAHVVTDLYECFKECFNIYEDTKFFCISGNHDLTTRNLVHGEAKSIMPLFHDNFDNFYCLDTYELGYFLIKEKVQVQGVPFYDKRDLWLKHLEAAKETKKQGYFNILLTHQTDTTQPRPDIFYEDVKDFGMVFNGHTHNFTQHAPNFYTVGNPLHRDLSDEGKDKFILLYDTEKGTVEKINLNMPTIQRIPLLGNSVDITSDYKWIDTLPSIRDSQSSFDAYVKTQNLTEQYISIGKNIIQ